MCYDYCLFLHSSRSHLILTISVDGINQAANSVTHGKLTLVDLAGSERISKTEATGQRLVEAAAINKSLTSLGQVCMLNPCDYNCTVYLYIQVFACLRNNSLHVPYRNSKLTHLLQSTLGGDAKVNKT